MPKAFIKRDKSGRKFVQLGKASHYLPKKESSWPGFLKWFFERYVPGLKNKGVQKKGKRGRRFRMPKPKKTKETPPQAPKVPDPRDPALQAYALALAKPQEIKLLLPPKEEEKKQERRPSLPALEFPFSTPVPKPERKRPSPSPAKSPGVKVDIEGKSVEIDPELVPVVEAAQQKIAKGEAAQKELKQAQEQKRALFERNLHSRISQRFKLSDLKAAVDAVGPHKPPSKGGEVNRQDAPDMLRYLLKNSKTKDEWQPKVDKFEAEIRKTSKMPKESGAPGPAEKSAAQEGTGGFQKAMTEDEINTIMSKYPGFAGTIARDEMGKLEVKPNKPLSFVMNLDKSGKPGSHWVAWYIDPHKDKSIEYYNSFGEAMPDDLLKPLKDLVEKLDPETHLKLKENRVVQQSDKSKNCGPFAIKFLVDRYRGKSFPECTGYSDVARGEKDIEKFKERFPPFRKFFG